MDNQHRKIAGDRELTPAEVDLINAIKQQGGLLELAVEGVECMPDADKRAASIAKTHLQTGLMWLVRAVARPQGF